MKRKILVVSAMMFLFVFMNIATSYAGQMEVLVNKLVEKGILTKNEAQILMAEAQEEAKKELAAGKAVTAPSWTQKIKIKGDVRDRLQINWGQRSEENARIRNRIRARIGIEGKVNDQIKAGVRIATGSTASPRSANQTLEHTFEEHPIWIDLGYIDWHTPIPDEIGSLNILGGKFKNPLNKTDLTWDGDINPEGIAFKYKSPGFDFGEVSTVLYYNGGWFTQENSIDKLDVYMIVNQAGMKMDIIKDWNSTFDLSLAYYDWAHIKNNSAFLANDTNAPVWSAGTNTRRANNQFRYDYNVFNFLVKYDSKKFFDFELGHGLHGDFIWNTDPGASRDFGVSAGGYLGNKKIKKPGHWKVFAEWRYLEQDAIPDFLPDADFSGWRTSNGLTMTGTGSTGTDGGTNGQGLKAGVQYGILKNTVLCLTYLWTEPIDMDPGVDKVDASFLQMDVKVKF